MKSGKEKKTIERTVRFTEKQWKRIDDEAAACGVSNQEAVRFAVSKTYNIDDIDEYPAKLIKRNTEPTT